MDILADVTLSTTQGPGCGRLWGHYSVHPTGVRTWTSLGTLLCPPHRDPGVDVSGDIILSTLRGSGRGCLWGHYSVHHTGVRTGTLLVDIMLLTAYISELNAPSSLPGGPKGTFLSPRTHHQGASRHQTVNINPPKKGLSQSGQCRKSRRAQSRWEQG